MSTTTSTAPVGASGPGWVVPERAPPDALRTHQARREIHTERDRLLKGADGRINLKKFMPSDGKDRARATFTTAMMSVFGMVPYVTMVLLWFFVYHSSFTETAVAFAALLLIGALFCLGSSRRALGKDRPWMWYFGLIWMQPAVVGCVLGFFLYFRDLAFYWKYEEMRTYTNVGAQQSAAAFEDGSMFLYTEDTRLDAMRAVGYQPYGGNGPTYCVAPLVDPSMNQASFIYYWAVGYDCCNSRGDFHCGSAADFSTRSALRVLNPDDVVRPFMRWVVRGNAYQEYIKAIHLQEDTYSTLAAPILTLIDWTRNPVERKDAFYKAAVTVCTWFSVVYFVLLAIGVYLLVAWRILPKRRHESVIREA